MSTYIDISDNLNNTNDNLDKGDKAIENSLRNILHTQIGTSPGNPEFGCNLYKYLFEILDPLTSKLIETEVRYAIQRFEPRIRINDIIVSEDIDYNKLKVLINYSLLNDINTYSYSTSIQR